MILHSWNYFFYGFWNLFTFSLYSVSLVLPPKVVTPSTLEAGISKPTSLTCKAYGTFGLNVEWENSVGSVYDPPNVYNVEREAKYILAPKLTELPKFNCKVHSSYLSCTQNFSCKSFYSFRKDVISKSATTVLVKVCKLALWAICILLFLHNYLHKRMDFMENLEPVTPIHSLISVSYTHLRAHETDS